MKKKTIYFTEGGGRFGNQYLTDMHFYAFQQEHPEIKFINLKIAPYIHFLKNRRNDYPVIIRTLNVLGRLFSKLNQIAANKFFDTIWAFFWHILSKKNTIFIGEYYSQINVTQTPRDELILNADFVQELGQNNIGKIQLRGRPINNWPLLIKHADVIRDKFRLNDNFYTQSEKLISKLKQKYDFVIGVAIRQTDYIGYDHLGYFISTNGYIDHIKTLKSYFKDKGSIAFVITSDERQDINLFPDNCHLAPGHIGGIGHYLEDMTALELCDVIAGPPSTFSFSACFLGDKPYIPLLKDMKKENFEIKSYKDVISSDIMKRVIQ